VSDLQVLYVGAVSLLCRMHVAMRRKERETFDGDGSPMERLARDFNKQGLSLRMIENGSTWILVPA